MLSRTDTHGEKDESEGSMEMNSTNGLLQCMKDELTWALEGSTAEWGAPYVRWSVVPDWSELHTIELESWDSIAVCAEGEVFVEDTLGQVEKEGWIQTFDPRYVAFRLTDRNTGVRESLMLIREAQLPPDRDLFALPQMVRSARAVVHLRTRAAGITFAGGRRIQEGPRKRSGRDRAAAATVS